MVTPGKGEREMSYSRILGLLAGAAWLAACSGNIGGGQSTLPGAAPSGLSGVQGFSQPTPTPTPVSASNVATIGDTVAAQPLPAVMGWSGSIAFAKPIPGPSPSPNASATPAEPGPSGGPVTIGITAAVVEPSEAPRFRDAAGAGSGSGKHASGAAKGLLFISLLSTADVTLGEYPKITVEMPRDVAAKYRDRPFALALFDPGTKAKSYVLDVAQRDMSSPAPGSLPVATPTPTPAATPTATPGGMMPMGMSAFTPPPIGGGVAGAGLPPEHVAFLGTAATLTLKANRAVVFAVYAAPAPSPSPSPLRSPLASPSPVRSPASPSPAPSPSPGASASPTPVPVPTRS
jgi:hypothetical protein